MRPSHGSSIYQQTDAGTMSDASEKAGQSGKEQSTAQSSGTSDSDSSMISEKMVASLLRDSRQLQPVSSVDVTDISGGCGTSFAITIVSNAFDKLSVLSRHRLVHAALGHCLDKIHAIQLKCYTPQAFAKLSSSVSTAWPTGHLQHRSIIAPCECWPFSFIGEVYKL